MGQKNIGYSMHLGKDVSLGKAFVSKHPQNITYSFFGAHTVQRVPKQFWMLH